MQVHIAEKCRFFAFLLCCVGIFAVIEYIFDFFVVRNRHGFGVDLAVSEVDIFRPLHLDTTAVSDDGYLVEEDIMHRLAFESLDINRLFGTDTGDIAESDIGPVGEECILVIGVGSGDTCSLVGIAGGDEEGGFADILHDDIIAIDVFAPSTTSWSGFEAAADVGTFETAVLDHQTLHTAGKLGPDDEAAMGTINGIVGDEEIALWTGIHAFLSDTAFHTDPIIAAGDIAVDDKRDLDISRVHGISVLRPVRAADVDAIYNKVLHARGHEVEFRRVEQMHILHKDILGVGDVHQMWAHLLLNDRILGYIRDIILLIEVERIPNEPFLAIAIGFGDATHREHFFPHIAISSHYFGRNDFLLLDRPPVDTLSVDRTMSGDGDVLQLGAVDERVAFLGTVTEGVGFLDIEFLIGRTQNNRIVREVQIQVANQLNRTGKPFAIGYDEVSATLFLEVLECFGERLGVVGHAIAYSAEVGDIHRVFRDDDFLNLFYCAGQILIVMGILRLRGSR